MSSVKSVVVVVPASTIASRTIRWKPGASTLTSYLPASSDGKLKSPRGETVIVRVRPVATLVVFALAARMAAPEASRITPAMAPVGVWGRAIAARMKNRAAFFAVDAP